MEQELLNLMYYYDLVDVLPIIFVLCSKDLLVIA